MTVLARWAKDSERTFRAADAERYSEQHRN